MFLWHAQSSSELAKMVPLPVTRPNNTGHSTLAYSCVAIQMRELTSVLILLSLVGKPRISFFFFFYIFLPPLSYTALWRNLKATLQPKFIMPFETLSDVFLWEQWLAGYFNQSWKFWLWTVFLVEKKRKGVDVRKEGRKNKIKGWLNEWTDLSVQNERKEERKVKKGRRRDKGRNGGRKNERWRKMEGSTEWVKKHMNKGRLHEGRRKQGRKE